ncbi:hypothetical protein [Pseudomonas mangrovi]|uniref:hypothetical protein n=1 Tax=Pseudomonas mangrovi TaxID=2161748 RepID=UPI0011B201B9|nr:hypothetical protein [Pseudomonas mangrovi]
MSKRQSKQKQRQVGHISLEEAACSEAKSIAARPFVLTVESHFAGYFNELGITITVNDTALSSDIIKLRNELQEKLEILLPSGTAPFSWQVIFMRTNKIIETLFPGDARREETDELKAV